MLPFKQPERRVTMNFRENHLMATLASTTKRLTVLGLAESILSYR
jgi:hypothetical protein